MLPLGRIAEAFGNGHETNFTKEEQKTMMTLWCIFGSPLMMGGEMPGFDEFTMDLITNREILHLQDFAGAGRQVRRNDNEAVWVSFDREKGTAYAALFNLSDESRKISLTETEMSESLSRQIRFDGKILKELWGEAAPEIKEGSLMAEVPAHGVQIYGIM
jgi:hypothetical protein